MYVVTLASGSSGNCVLVSDGETHLLVDAGISTRRIQAALAQYGLTAADLSGILITHEHSDHIAGLATLVKRCDAPIYTGEGTARALCCRLPVSDRIHSFRPGAVLDVCGLRVDTVPTEHDAAAPVGYALTAADGRKAAVVTDLGAVTDAVWEAVRGSHVLVVETNHNIALLQGGGYPYYLKKRILGVRGHLSNEDGARLAAECARWGAHTLVLAHLSQDNNRPDLATDAVACALTDAGVDASKIAVEVAPRHTAGTRHLV